MSQSKKQLHKNIKPSLWKRIGFVPNWKSKKEIHQESYKARLNLPEGKETHRSEGSNIRLKKLLRY